MDQQLSGEPATDISGRPFQLRTLDLERFFQPKSIAVLGASDREGSPAAGMTNRMRAWAEVADARLFLINPNRESVGGIACLSSLADVAGPVDLVVVVTNDAVSAVDAAIEARARFVLVFASGFAELGPEGKLLQQRVADAILRSETRLVGPNTNLNAFDRVDRSLLADQAGIGLVTQSGHQGRPVFQSQENGVALAFWATTGNEADVEFADFVKFYADHPDVGVITAYIEGFKDGRTFLLVADYALKRGKPVVAVKVGRTAAGTAMAQSHTGKLTGADGVTDGAFAQVGAVRVDDLDELIDTSQLFARARKPQGDGVCVYAISGGTGAHVADLCAVAGLQLPKLSEATQQALHQWIPPYLSVSNPVDNGGHPVGDWRGMKILETLIADPAISVLICPITGSTPPSTDRLAADLAEIAEKTDKLICVVWGSPSGLEPAYRETLLGSHRLAVFRNFRNCVNAVDRYLRFYDFADHYHSPFDQPALRESGSAQFARTLLRQTPQFTEVESKRLLAAYGIPVTRDHVVETSQEAVAAAQHLGYPVVLKGLSTQIAHKSEFGLVQTSLADEDDVRRAFASIEDAASMAGETLEGFLVSEQIEGGLETILGLVHDEVFGPTVMFGMGGIEAEVSPDVSYRVPPFCRCEATKMINELRAAPLFHGFRGKPRLAVEAVEDAIMRFHDMALDLALELREVETNPLFVLPGGVVAADALVVAS